jgi:hypothetical protein
MKKELSDEQLDTFMQGIVKGSTADEALITEIADSPATWWGVQRTITEQKPIAQKSPWPPVGKVLRWLLIGVPAAAAAVLLISLLVFRPSLNIDKGEAALTTPSSTMITAADTLTSPDKGTIFSSQPVVNPTKQAKRNIVSAKVARTEMHSVRTPAEINVVAPAKEEIKTDFIALSYARDPESGQIVRVKVPRALMVSLGVVASDKTPSGMVDAEVLVGDDGLTRAIRFIR